MRLVSIIGLSNAGKSTLFNQIIKKKASLVADCNSTKDYVAARAGDLLLMDLCGLDVMNDFCSKQLEKSELLIYVLRGEMSQKELEELKKQTRKGKKLWLYLNRPLREEEYLPEYLFERVFQEDQIDLLRRDVGWFPEPEKKLAVALLGRANSGKSSLFNRFLGFNRSIVKDEFGTTRDCIWEKYKDIQLVDTPGYGNQLNNLDRLINRNLEAQIRSFQGIILVLDGRNPITKQDKLVYGKLNNIGCFSCIFIHSSGKMHISMKAFLDRVRGIPVFYSFAALRENLSNLIDYIGLKISTSKLNKWFHDQEWRLTNNRRAPVKIKYLHQKKDVTVGLGKPLEIIYHAKSFLSPNSLRTLKRKFREDFKLPGLQVFFYGKNSK
jgi:small GTP-binding protein